MAARNTLIGAVAAALAVAMACSSPAGSAAPVDLDELAAAKRSIMANPSAAYDHAQKALAGALREPPSSARTAAETSARWLSGEALTQMKQPSRALPLLDQAFRSASAPGQDPTVFCDVIMSRGRAEAATGAVGAALGDFQDAYRRFGTIGNSRGRSKALEEIGSLYLKAREYPRALHYYEQARAILAGSPAPRVDNNLGEAFKEMGRFADSEQAFKVALAEAAPMHSAYLQAHLLSNIALTELQQNKILAARASVGRGLALAQTDRAAATERPFLLSTLAAIDARSGAFGRAAALLDRVFADPLRDENDPEWRDPHEQAAAVYDRLGRPRLALEHYKAFKRLDDQGRALAASTEAALLSAQFDFADQRAKIARLQADAQMKEAAMAKREARSTLVLGAVIVLGGILVIGLMLQALVSLRRSGARLSALNDELSTSNIALEKALNARTEFLAMTSHEIRTPLNGILGMTQVMLAEPEAQGELRDRLEIIRASGVTMNALLTDLLDIAKIEKGHVTIERSEIDLPAMVGAMAPMWSEKAAQQGLSFELDLTRCPNRIVEDAAMLRQILSNLLANAVKFTPAGSVFMGLATRETRDGERLIITVSDSGIGIPQDQFERVFEAFTQVDGGTSRHYGGTGLGLAICKNLARSLGGEISVESVVGAGSTFTVDLPLTRALPVGDEGADSEGDLSRAFVLGVEDNPLSQALLRSALKGKVRGLEFAARPEDALSERALAPDLLVVDGACLQRHHPQDPFAPIQRLRRSFRAPMVVLWPSMTPADSARLKSLGVERVLAKPVMAAALNAALEQTYVQSLAPRRQSAVVG